MKFFVNPRSGVPIYKQIIKQVEKGVVGGILKPGTRLPTVRDVALELTINPNTVARAYRDLEVMGLVETVQGRGTFIATNVKAKPEERLEIISELLRQVCREAEQLGFSKTQLQNLFNGILAEEE